MTSLILTAPGAVIHAADTARRTIAGRVITYGEYGNTSAGRKRFLPGSIELPTDTPTRVLLLRGHTGPDGKPQDNGDGVQAGAAVKLLDDPVKLDAEFRVTSLPIGDTLLAEADPTCPIRAGLSVEVHDVEYDPADPSTVIRARLSAVAAVPFQAYPSSRMTSVAASAHDHTGDPSVTAPVDAPAPAAEPAAPAAPALDYSQLAAALAPHLTAAAAPAGLPTGGLTAAAPAPTAEPTGGDLLGQLATLQAQQAVQGGSDRELRAALADITNSDLPLFQRPAGAIPQELWRTIGYTRRYVPLLTQRPLTSMNFGGWEFVDLPQVDDWSGDKTEVPTNEVTTREITGTASRIAGGWDIDRKFRDFGDSAFWTAFYQAQTESYARKTDLKAVAAIVAAAQDVTATAAVTGYTRPPGYGTVTDQADVLKAVAFGTAYLEDTPLIYDHPDYVLMNTSDWLSLLNITNLDLPAFLTLLGVEPGSFLRSPFVPQGSVILGINEALQWYELPGAAPIRVEALDVARGGIDDAVFGYWGTLHTRPGGIISVPLGAG